MIGLGSAGRPLEPTRVIAKVTERLRAELERVKAVLRSVVLSGLTTVDSTYGMVGVSRNTMSFALPENMREYIDAQVSDTSYGNTSEYQRE